MPYVPVDGCAGVARAEEDGVTIVRRVRKRDKAVVWMARPWDKQLGRSLSLGTFSTEAGAKRALSNFYGAQRARNPITVDELAERWLTEWSVQREWAESTKMHNRGQVQAFRQKHAKREAEDITKSDALSWAAAHKSQASALKAMFGFAVFIEAVQSNPFANLGIKQSRGRADIVALTEDELIRLADCASEALDSGAETLRAMVLFSGFTGLRAGELFVLKHSDLGHDEMTVRRAYSSKSKVIGPPKNGNSRTVALFPQAREAVQSVPRQMGVEWVFPAPGGQHFTQTAHLYYWNQVRAKFGRKLAWHELRHAAATIMLARGLSHADVAFQLGHSDASLVLKRYGHPSQDLARERLKAAFSDNVKPLVAVTKLAPKAAEAP